MPFEFWKIKLAKFFYGYKVLKSCFRLLCKGFKSCSFNYFIDVTFLFQSSYLLTNFRNSPRIHVHFLRPLQRQKLLDPLSWKWVLCNWLCLSVRPHVCPSKFCNLPLSDLCKILHEVGGQENRKSDTAGILKKDLNPGIKGD